MKKKRITILAAALIAITATAGGTITLLSHLDGQKSDDDSPRVKIEPTTEGLVEEEFREDIDDSKNKKAREIEGEAESLMESNPAEAHQKYLEAEIAYEEAGNMSKVGEMRANALTAQTQMEEESS